MELEAWVERDPSAAALVAGPLRPRDLRPNAPKAAQILRDNYYGWFDRAERGIYALSAAGHEALQRWPQTNPNDGP